MPKRRRNFRRKGKFRRRRRNNFSNPANREIKFYDETNLNANQPASAGGKIWSNSLINIPEGTGQSERIGRKINVVGVGMTMEFVLPVTTFGVEATDNMRVILYLDKQANGAVPIPADILTISVAVGSYRNLANVDRFRILYDKIHSINSGAGTGTTDTLEYAARSFFRKAWVKANIPVLYSGLGGGTVDIKSNNLGILVVSSNVKCLLTIHSRVRYIDM